MALHGPVLLAVTLAALGLAGVVIGVVVPRINRASKRAQESVGAMGAALERMFGAFRTVKASGAEEREGQRLDAAATEAWRASVRAAKWAPSPATRPAWRSRWRSSRCSASAGSGSPREASPWARSSRSCCTCSSSCAPVNQLAGAVTQYQVGAAAVARILEAEALPVEPAGAPAGLPEPGSPARHRSPSSGCCSGMRRTCPSCTTASASSSPRRDDRVRRSVRRRQDLGLVPYRAVLRTGPGPCGRRRQGRARLADRAAASLHRLRRAGRAGVVRDSAGEPRLRCPRRDR